MESNPQTPSNNPIIANKAASKLSSIVVTSTKATADESVSSAVSTTKTPSESESQSSVRANPLSDLSSYTYSLLLEAIPNSNYANFKQNGYNGGADWHYIAASGGMAADYEYTGNYFGSDYYLDNLEFKTIVTTNSQARAISVVELKFDLIEPYGINFLNELWEFNTYLLQNDNYLETCYMLTIRWKGYDNNGAPVSILDEKQIPFKICNIEIKLTNAGAVYSISAVPFDHQLNLEAYGRLTTQAELNGATVSEMLVGGGGNNGVNNLLSILNGRADANISQPDIGSLKTEYEIEVDPVIGGSKVADPSVQPSSVKSMDFPKNSVTATAIQNMTLYALTGDKNSRKAADAASHKLNFPPTTQIVSIINQVIINSTYISDQIKEYNDEANKIFALKDESARARAAASSKVFQKPINWFKIIPSVSKLDNDVNTTTNLNKKTIKLTIKPFTISNSRMAHNIIGSKRPQASDIVKEYFYYFTGNNTEIINCDLSFNTTYYNFLQRNLQNVNQGSGGNQTETSVDKNQAGVTKISEPVIAAGATPPAASIKHENADTETAMRNKSHQIANSLYGPVDLITINLEIMGDPDLIAQDCLGVVNPQASGVAFNSSEKYTRLTFVTPTDIDVNTGTLAASTDESKTSRTVFDGLYVLISIENHFKQGKFTQNLEMYKAYTIDSAIVDRTNTDPNQVAQTSVPLAE